MNADADNDRAYVSRGGEKLAAALDAFGIDVRGRRVVDFGSHVGGFVDCLLRRGAAHVTAVEPGKGVLHDSLRRDPRVAVCEGQSALRFAVAEPFDLITIDVGWTPLRLVLPVAARCLRFGGDLVALIKPHYEAPKAQLVRGVLPPEHLAAVLEACRGDTTSMGWRIVATIESPLRGHGGNIEHLWHLRRS